MFCLLQLVTNVGFFRSHRRSASLPAGTTNHYPSEYHIRSSVHTISRILQIKKVKVRYERWGSEAVILVFGNQAAGDEARR